MRTLIILAVDFIACSAFMLHAMHRDGILRRK